MLFSLAYQPNKQIEQQFAFNTCTSKFAFNNSRTDADDEHPSTLALFSSPRNSKSFQYSLSHRILRHMHEALNIHKNKN